MKRSDKITWIQAAEWIARNDDPDCLVLKDIQGSITVTMIADLTGISIEYIAQRVLFHRQFWVNGQAAPVQRLTAGGVEQQSACSHATDNPQGE